MQVLKKFWRYLDRWDVIVGYLIGGVMLLLNGDLYNNGFTDIRWVYFFNVSGILMLGIMVIKIIEKLLKKRRNAQL